MSWMEGVARAAEARLDAAGIRLTLGGEPTLVPVSPEGAEWSVSADGPTKLPIARALANDLQRQVWPGSTLLYCPGKRYEGEVNPRWALRLILGNGGTPLVHWPEPCQPGLGGLRLRPEGALAWLQQLGSCLGITLHPVALRDPLDPERLSWAALLTTREQELAGDDDEPIEWLAAPWPLAVERRELNLAPGPAGLRLPLEHFPEDIPRQVLTLELDPLGWELFLPPLGRRPMVLLLQAIADSLGDLAAPRLSGMLPIDMDGHWQTIGLTADPGVLEINLPVCHSWAEYNGWLRNVEQAGTRNGLRSWKQKPNGLQEGTGGGNHLLWGGPSLEDHPFFSRPGWLAGILRYWQHHPVLSYLFCGPCVGPASQAPRPDEALGDLFDLELAYRSLEEAEIRTAGMEPESERDHRWLIGETLRHLHADRSGNNHRSEISFDKFWNPGAPAGCLGLVEFRAMESLPHVEWSSAIALLWSALAAHLLEPVHRPAGLKRWGHALHDRMLLPSQLWLDLEGVLAELAADGLRFDPAPYRAIWEWRFPPLLRWKSPHPTEGREDLPKVELLPALEPWPLICDFPREGGFTSRFIDASLRRFEVVANAAFLRDCILSVNGRPVPLEAPRADGGDDASMPLAVRFRHHRLYPCLHPAVDPHLPLQIGIHDRMGTHHFELALPEGQSFLPIDGPGLTADRLGTASAWRGRVHHEDVTIDLRVD